MLAASNALSRLVPLFLLASLPLSAAVRFTAAIAAQQQQLPGKAPRKTGAIEGVVRDSNGRAVGGAIVALRNVATGEIRKATSTAEGIFRLIDLPPGKYELSVACEATRHSRKRACRSAAGEVLIREIKLVAGPIAAPAPHGTSAASADECGADRDGIVGSGIFRGQAESRSAARRRAARAGNAPAGRRRLPARAESLARHDARLESLRHGRRASLREGTPLGPV